jgi:hypothetical protein
MEASGHLHALAALHYEEEPTGRLSWSHRQSEELWERKPRFYRETNTDASATQPVTSRYTERIIPSWILVPQIINARRFMPNEFICKHIP